MGVTLNRSGLKYLGPEKLGPERLGPECQAIHKRKYSTHLLLQCPPQVSGHPREIMQKRHFLSGTTAIFTSAAKTILTIFVCMFFLVVRTSWFNLGFVFFFTGSAVKNQVNIFWTEMTLCKWCYFCCLGSAHFLERRANCTNSTVTLLSGAAFTLAPIRAPLIM